jgi:Ni,Fe-hydrogenase III component G
MNKTLGSSHYLAVKKTDHVSSIEIPVLSYSHFYTVVSELLQQPANHCTLYTAYQEDGDRVKFICYIQNDLDQEIKILSHELPAGDRKQMISLSKDFSALYPFEKEIAKNFGIDFLYLNASNS